MPPYHHRPEPAAVEWELYRTLLTHAQDLQADLLYYLLSNRYEQALSLFFFTKINYLSLIVTQFIILVIYFEFEI